jgi:hypothetical protein
VPPGVKRGVDSRDELTVAGLRGGLGLAGGLGLEGGLGLGLGLGLGGGGPGAGSIGADGEGGEMVLPTPSLKLLLLALRLEEGDGAPGERCWLRLGPPGGICLPGPGLPCGGDGAPLWLRPITQCVSRIFQAKRSNQIEV